MRRNTRTPSQRRILKPRTLMLNLVVTWVLALVIAMNNKRNRRTRVRAISTRTLQPHHSSVIGSRNLISLWSRKVQNNSCNRRIAEKQSGTHALQRSMIDFQNAQCGRRHRTRKVDNDAIRPSDGLRIGRHCPARSLNLHFDCATNLPRHNFLNDASLIRSRSRRHSRLPRKRQ